MDKELTCNFCYCNELMTPLGVKPNSGYFCEKQIGLFSCEVTAVCSQRPSSSQGRCEIKCHWSHWLPALSKTSVLQFAQGRLTMKNHDVFECVFTAKCISNVVVVVCDSRTRRYCTDQSEFLWWWLAWSVPEPKESISCPLSPVIQY